MRQAEANIDTQIEEWFRKHGLRRHVLCHQIKHIADTQNESQAVRDTAMRMAKANRDAKREKYADTRGREYIYIYI